MRYYVIHQKQKYYFEFNLQGFKEAQLFIEKCGYKKRTIHVEKGHTNEQSQNN